jgi:hypothetical protein
MLGLNMGLAAMVRRPTVKLSRTALIDRNDVRVHLDTKIAAASSPRSGVGWSAVFGLPKYSPL